MGSVSATSGSPECQREGQGTSPTTELPLPAQVDLLRAQKALRDWAYEAGAVEIRCHLERPGDGHEGTARVSWVLAGRRYSARVAVERAVN